MRCVPAAGCAVTAPSTSRATSARREGVRRTDGKARALGCEPRQRAASALVSQQTSNRFTVRGLRVLLRRKLLRRVHGAQEGPAGLARDVELLLGQRHTADAAPLGEVVVERALFQIHRRTSAWVVVPAGSGERSTARRRRL